MKRTAAVVAALMCLPQTTDSFSLRRHQRVPRLSPLLLLSIEEESNNATNGTNGTTTTPPIDSDLVLIHGHQETIEVLKSVCEHSRESLQNATEAWESVKVGVVEKLSLAATSIADAHEDETEQDGTSTLDHLDAALNKTQQGLLMRPAVKGLRDVKDATNQTSIKACGKYDAAEADLTLLLNEIATKLLKSRDAMKLKIIQSESEINKELAVSNHMVRLAEHAHAAAAAAASSAAESAGGSASEEPTEEEVRREETIDKTIGAVSSSASAGIKAKMYVNALKERRHELLQKLNMVLELSGRPKIEEKQAEEEVTLPPPSWNTPALDKAKAEMVKAALTADEAKVVAEESVVDDVEDEEDASGGGAGGEVGRGVKEEASEAVPVVVAAPLTPLDLLRQRLVNLTTQAMVHLNTTLSDKVEGKEEEKEQPTMEKGEKGSVTRTFVS